MPYKNKADFLEYNRIRRKRLYDTDLNYRKDLLAYCKSFRDKKKLAEFEQILSKSKARHDSQMSRREQLMKDIRGRSPVGSHGDAEKCK